MQIVCSTNLYNKSYIQTCSLYSMVRKKKRILSKEKLEQDSPRNREMYADDIILEFLDRKPNGVSITQIVSRTKLARNTVNRHLERLVAIGKIGKRDFGHLALYFKGGYVDEESEEKYEFSNERRFVFQLVNRGIEGNYIYIQQREVGPFREEKVTGGIMIDVKDAKVFSKLFHTYALKVPTNEHNR